MKLLWDYNKSSNIEIEKKLGNTYTHPYISKNIITEFVDLNKSYNNVLEPSVGSGSFYYNMLDLIDCNHIDVFDVDLNALDLIEGSDTTTKYHESFITHDFKEKKYDLIITNPPYISYNNLCPTDSSTQEKKEFVNSMVDSIDLEILGIEKSDIGLRSDIFLYFFLKSMSLLSEDGKIIFLCSDKWMMSNYGFVLRKLLTSRFKLESITASVYYPFFRDDTNAIVTVISRRKNNEDSRLILNQILEPRFKITESSIISSTKMDELFLSDCWIKNDLILYPQEKVITETIIRQIKPKLTKMSNICTINNRGKGINEYIRAEQVVSTKSKDTIPLFFQKQARVGSPAIYKSGFNITNLQYHINRTDVNVNSIVSDNLYLTSVIDKFPLVFLPNGETASTSKYMVVEFINDSGILFNGENNLPSEILPIIFHSIITLLMIETFSQEATKRSMRKNKNGVVKKLRKNILMDLRIPNFKIMSKSDIATLVGYYDAYKEKQIFTLEQALNEESFVKLNKTIFRILGIEDFYEPVLDNLKSIYYRRLRDLEKLNYELVD